MGQFAPAAAAHDSRRRQTPTSSPTWPAALSIWPAQPKEFWMVDKAKHNQALQSPANEAYKTAGSARSSSITHPGEDRASGQPTANLAATA